MEELEFEAEAEPVTPAEVDVNTTVTVPPDPFVTKEVITRVVGPAASVLLAIDCVESADIVDIDD